MSSNDQRQAIEQACAYVEVHGPADLSSSVRGTAYRISKRFVVTSERVVRGLALQSTVQLLFPDGPRNAVLQKSDAQTDCAVLELLGDAATQEGKSLRLSVGCERGASWEAYGYAAAEKPPAPLSWGEILDTEGEDPQRSPAIVLRSQTAITQSAAGSPVLVDGQVIGHLKWRLDSESSDGPLYACPIRHVEALLPVEGRKAILQPPQASYAPAWYVSRPEEEQKALGYLAFPGQPVVLWGPELFGKTWLLRHLTRQIQEQDASSQVVIVNLDLFDKSSWQQPQGLDTFLRELALHVALALGEPAETVYAEWATPSPTANMDRVMRRRILPRLVQNQGRLLLAIECADAVLGSPLQNTFFGILRGWAESEEPWSCLRLLLSISTTPALLVSTQHQSPFNLTDAVELKDLGDEQLLRLCSMYQLKWGPKELELLKHWVGGHPYLARMAMYTAARQNVSLHQLLDAGHPAGNVFDGFLSRARARMRRHPERYEAFQAMLSDPHADLGEAELPLLRAGLLIRDGKGRHAPRYELYRRLSEPSSPAHRFATSQVLALGETSIQPVPQGVQREGGQVVVGKHLGPYQIIRQIGRGGMGVVYEVMYEQIKRRAALKVLHPQFLRDQEAAKRFINEARAANVVQHPGIISVFEIGSLADGQLYFIMEYLEGESLGDRLKRIHHFSLLSTIRLSQQIAVALAAAHQKGVVHRDLKPGNVMAVHDALIPGGERTRLLDFGLAKIEKRTFEDSVTTSLGMLMGTPIYMSPEQCRGIEQIDGQADVYALGVMIFEFLTGRPPFDAEDLGMVLAMHMRDPPPSLAEVMPELPAELCKLVSSMLAKEPLERPTMADVAEVLLRLDGPLSTSSSLPSVPPPMAWYWIPAVWAALGMFMVLLGWLLFFRR